MASYSAIIYFGIDAYNLDEEEISTIEQQIGLETFTVYGKNKDDGYLFYGKIKENGTGFGDEWDITKLAKESLKDLIPKTELIKQLQDEYRFRMNFCIDITMGNFNSEGTYQMSLGFSEMKFLCSLNIKPQFTLEIENDLP